MGIPGIPTGIDAQVLKMEDRLAQLERLNRHLTAQLTLVTNNAVGVPLPFPTIHEQSLAGGPTSGTTVLALGTIVVPAFAVPTIQYPSAQWGFLTSTAGGNDGWRFCIRDDTTTGAIRGSERETLADTNAVRQAFSVVTTPGRVTPAATSRTYVTTIERVSGDGTINSAEFGHMSVLVLVDFS